jgi:hypothetical protein
VTGFIKNAFIPGEAYRIQLKTESAVRNSIDCDLWDDISSSRIGSMTKTKLLDVMEKGIAAIFLGFEDNLTVAVFETYGIGAAGGYNLRATSPDKLRINARDYANGDCHHGDFDIYIENIFDSFELID